MDKTILFIGTLDDAINALLLRWGSSGDPAQINCAQELRNSLTAAKLAAFGE
ncbi:hypothetical protein GF380_01115 [Candidatus Uhrbacteria bacterium]|nr:hypothetical protein [Candidatus Uhrbacteria bacterium]